MTLYKSKDYKIPSFREAMDKIELNWNKHYRLVDDGKEFQLQWLRPVTDEQYREGLALLESELNR